jgi:hypothetical protein
VVEDANGLIVGVNGGFDFVFQGYTALRKVGSDVVAIGYVNGSLGYGTQRVFFQNPGCTGDAFMDPTATPYLPGVVIGTTLYYPSSAAPASAPYASLSSASLCYNTTGTEVAVPVVATTVPLFTLPFHVEVP